LSNRLRGILLVIMIMLLIVSVYFILTERREIVYSNYSSQYLVCQLSLPVGINSNQTIVKNCSVQLGNWLSLSIRADTNVTVSVLSNSGSQGGNFLLFNETGTNIVANFPFQKNETVLISITNHQLSPALVTGITEILGASVLIVENLLILNPYRRDGYVIAAISVIALFFLVWNPNKIMTRGLDRTTRGLTKRDWKLRMVSEA